jgi:hypothetical protein
MRCVGARSAVSGSSGARSCRRANWSSAYADQELVFGHNVWALTLTYDAIGHRNQLYIDPATGHVIGDAWLRTGHRADPSTCPRHGAYPGPNEPKPTTGPCLWVTYPPSQQPYNGQQLFFASLVTFTQGLAFPVTQPGN